MLQKIWKEDIKKGSSVTLSLGKVIKEKELTVFTRQLATLLEAGLPLLKSIDVMIRQEPNKRFKVVLEKMLKLYDLEALFLMD